MLIHFVIFLWSQFSPNNRYCISIVTSNVLWGHVRSEQSRSRWLLFSYNWLLLKFGSPASAGSCHFCRTQNPVRLGVGKSVWSISISPKTEAVRLFSIFATAIISAQISLVRSVARADLYWSLSTLFLTVRPVFFLVALLRTTCLFLLSAVLVKFL